MQTVTVGALHFDAPYAADLVPAYPPVIVERNGDVVKLRCGPHTEFELAYASLDEEDAVDAARDDPCEDSAPLSDGEDRSAEWLSLSVYKDTHFVEVDLCGGGSKNYTFRSRTVFDGAVGPWSEASAVIML